MEFIKHYKYFIISASAIVLILLGLLLAYYLTMSTYDQGVWFEIPGDNGNFTCGQLNFHGHTRKCEFNESYKENLQLVFLEGPLLLTAGLIKLTVHF